MNAAPNPPRLLAGLARRVVIRVADAEALATMHEHYGHRVASRGRASANRWYLRQLAGFAVGVPTRRLADLVLGDGGMLRQGAIRGDVTYALRMFRKRPSTTVLAVVALALGVGLTATMYSIVEGVLLRGLPFERADRLMFVGRIDLVRPGRPGATSPHDFTDWRAEQSSFESLAGFTQVQRIVGGGSAPAAYHGALVTPNAFGVLRTRPALGRDFGEADALPGATPVVILSDRLWRAQFDAAASAIGRVIRVAGVPATVIGVMPPRFGFPEAEDFWQPYRIELPQKRGAGSSVRVIGRLRDGVSRARAQAEFSAIAQGLAARFPENQRAGVRVISLLDHLLPFGTVTPLISMFLAVCGVMLMAASNVTNMQLARAAERATELAVRASLGASRGRLIRQMLVEGFVLAAAGALAGMGITILAVRLFNRAIVDTDPPFFLDVRVDTGVVACVSVLMVVAAVVSTLMPALRATRAGATAGLKAGAGPASALRMSRFGRGLVIGEVFTACVLLVVSGLMIKSVVLSAQSTYSFPTRDVLIASLRLDGARTHPDGDLPRLLDQIEQRVAAVPGLRAATLTSGPVPTTSLGRLAIEGRDEGRAGASPFAGRLAVTPAFFDVMQVRLLRGRSLGAADTAGRTLVAVVDDAFAARHFDSSADALGRRIKVPAIDGEPWLEIVGVVATLSASASREMPRGTVYVPIAQWPTRAPTLLAAAAGAGDPLASVRDVRRAILATDQDAGFTQPATLASYLARDRWRFRVAGGLFLSFGMAALVLAAAGLYGVMAFGVRNRTYEIGVRLALGASRHSVAMMILREGLTRVGLGILLGLLPAWGLATLLSSWIYSGVAATDLPSYGTTVLLLAVTGTWASLIPARRAASVDPIIALRAN